MPESPEVKLTTEYLKSKLENSVIVDWVFTRKKNPNGFDKFTYALPLIVENVECKGKFIYFTLFNETGYFYVLHSLRMTGEWQDNEDKYCNSYIELMDGENIWFRDPRCFATFEFTDKQSMLKEYLFKLGPDIMSDEFSIPVWNELIKKHKNKNITSFLMNQDIISGIGNYLKAEVLYYAKISPLRKTGDLSCKEIRKLYEAIIIIPRIIYNKKILSKSDYESVDKKGYYNGELCIYGKICAQKDKTSDGRITFWDPNKQF